MNDPCSHASPKHPEQCSFLCAHFRLYPLVPAMTTVSHSVGPGPLHCLGCMKCYKRRHIVSKEKPFQKNTRLFLNLNDKCINWSRLCNQNLVHLRLPGSCGTGRMPLAKKKWKTSFLPWFVLCFFCRWDLEITAPFYMTGSNLLPNYGGLLIWIGWTWHVGPMESNTGKRDLCELCGWIFFWKCMDV